MRMVSLAIFGIVLLKLVLDDLWAMPTIGKVNKNIAPLLVAPSKYKLNSIINV